MADKSSHSEANRVMNKFYMFENVSHRGAVEDIGWGTDIEVTPTLTSPSVWNFIQYPIFTIEQVYDNQ